jgi:6-phosphogluconolactonase
MIAEDALGVAAAAAQTILAAASEALARRGVFRLVLAGGRTPRAAYSLLAEADARWAQWQIYFGDERCVPATHPQRNSLMVWQAWLAKVAIAPGNVHEIPAELGPDAAAERYRDHVQRALPFDLVLLGLGPDGHTASLFPGRPHDPEALVEAVHNAPKPPPQRVSLGLGALNACRQLVVLVTGADKREAVRQWRRGDRLPVAQLRGLAGVDVLLDRQAAGSGEP